MFHGTLQRRIVFIFLGLLLAIQAVSFLLIRSSINHNARQALNDSLEQGAQVFTRVLQQNADHLLQTTQVLAQDYGFRSAVASDDRDTIASALSNHGSRVGASIAIFTDAQFNVKASQGTDKADLIPQLQRVGRVQLGERHPTDNDTHVIVLDGQAYQLVAVPVKAPLTIGWVFMGFRLGPALLADARGLAGVQSAVLVQSNQGQWRTAVSTVSAEQSQRLVEYLQEQALSSAHASVSDIVDIKGSDYLVRRLPLALQGNDQAVAVLLKSVDEAIAPYHRLQVGILFLTAVGIALFAVGSAATARRITTPLQALTKSARRLGQGDYDAHIPPQGNDEIGELAQAFESMRATVREREDQIKNLAFNDALTRLPNRLGFTTQVQHAVDRFRQAKTPCAVLKLDLDRFRQVNDSLGYEIGDQLLRQVALRLQTVLQNKGDVLARRGGNEFALLLCPCDRQEALEAAARVHQVLEQPMVIDDNRIDLSAGVGVALCPDDADSAQSLMQCSELALNQAKRKQIPTVFFTDDMNTRGKHSLSQLGEMRTALEQGHMHLFLQPQVRIADGTLTGAEGLLRWIHPERGIIPPMNFIPFAEQTGFVRHLTAWIIREGAKVVSQWQAQGRSLNLSLNLSARDLADHDLIDKISAALAEYGVPASAFCLEITESSIMDEPQRAMQILDRLHGMGIRLAIDDFGTGYSSLAYLKRLPVDELKIDKSFVMNMERDLQDAKIVRSTIDLAHNLGLKVVAEGLENAHAWQLLQSLSCDIAQGYWIAKPMPAADFEGWMSGWRRPEAGTWVMPSAWANLT